MAEQYRGINISFENPPTPQSKLNTLRHHVDKLATLSSPIDRNAVIRDKLDKAIEALRRIQQGAGGAYRARKLADTTLALIEQEGE